MYGVVHKLCDRAPHDLLKHRHYSKIAVKKTLQHFRMMVLGLPVFLFPCTHGELGVTIQRQTRGDEEE